MNIKNFTERQNVADLHDTFFDPNSETDISYLLSHVEFNEILSKKKIKKLERLLREVGDNIWDSLTDFDKLKLKEWKKQT